MPHGEIKRLASSATTQPFATQPPLGSGLSVCRRGPFLSSLAHRHATWNERTVKLGIAMT